MKGSFLGGAIFMAVGYGLAYYAINVLIWAHQPPDTSNLGAPVPLSYVLGITPRTKDQSNYQWHPPFTLSSDDAQRAQYALGAGSSDSDSGSTTNASNTVPASSTNNGGVTPPNTSFV